MIYKNLVLDWLGHSAFRIKTPKKIIYIDPFKLPDELEIDQADVILITHSHYDHCSIEDIKKIAKKGTIIIAPADVSSKFRHIDNKIELRIVESNARNEIFDGEIKVWTIPAYNLNKTFHEKEEEWLGYVLSLEGIFIYHAGDTDLIPEMNKLKSMNLDIALLPIGGTYTMNAGEAAKAASLIKPKLAIPMHYGSLEKTGSKNEAEIFLKLCSSQGIDARVI